ncbi:class I adenylate-forming enzyme family protein [Microbaculum marinum]|uniref:Class I adenylate-forming enzyme family protein n=1 Tax=Microbaculum marinum TaxID=1764581 RepID=A0AAW9RLI0_9HYPH
MIRKDLIAPLPELLRRQAEARPDKVAFSDDSGEVSYRDLYRTTANLAGHLAEWGIGDGRAVAVMLPNSVPWIQACFAAVRAGAIAVPINYDAPLAEVAYRLEDAGCRVLVTTDERYALVRDTVLALGISLILVDRAGHAPVGEARFSELAAEAPGRAAPDPDRLHDPAFIVYTSGTTGRAKGVLLTLHGILWVTASCWAVRMGLTEDDRFLSTVPLFHSYALNTTVLTVVALGASARLCERFSTQETIRLLESGEFTFFPGVPTQYHYLLNATGPDHPPFPNLRMCITGGAVMAASVVDAFEKRFQVPLLDGYGITETSTFVAMNAPAGGRVPGSCGLPFAGLCVRIVDPADGRDVEPETVGELIVRGPTIMPGYHNKPEETASAIRDGWYHTGDLARFDRDGFITITGRLKELIIRGGQNIAPAEIEEVVVRHEGIADCAAVACPHAELGEVPVVFVALAPDAEISAEALIAHCRTYLSAYKVPEAVHVVPDIPRTGSGKIMRFQLIEKLKDIRAGGS